MKVEYQNNTTFGQKVPTRALFKSALGIQAYEDAKELNYSLGIKYTGRKGFYPRAAEIANLIVDTNPTVKSIVDGLKKLTTTKQQLVEINSVVNKYGESIDVIV